MAVHEPPDTHLMGQKRDSRGQRVVVGILGWSWLNLNVLLLFKKRNMSE